jgi:DNA-binding MarR family transcriptional regulator
MKETLTDSEMDAWQALLHAHHQIVRKLDTELRAQHGLTFGDYDVLVRLARAPGRRLRMTELAKRVMISPSGLTRAVDALVREKLIERERSESDARVVFARLTDAGLKRVRTAASTHLRGIRQHFTGQLTETQLRHLASALKVITGPHTPH